MARQVRYDIPKVRFFHIRISSFWIRCSAQLQYTCSKHTHLFASFSVNAAAVFRLDGSRRDVSVALRVEHDARVVPLPLRGRQNRLKAAVKLLFVREDLSIPAGTISGVRVFVLKQEKTKKQRKRLGLRLAGASRIPFRN